MTILLLLLSLLAGGAAHLGAVGATANQSRLAATTVSTTVPGPAATTADFNTNNQPRLAATTASANIRNQRGPATTSAGRNFTAHPRGAACDSQVIFRICGETGGLYD